MNSEYITAVLLLYLVTRFLHNSFVKLIQIYVCYVGTKLYIESWYKVSYPGSDVLDLKYERPVK